MKVYTSTLVNKVNRLFLTWTLHKLPWSELKNISVMCFKTQKFVFFYTNMLILEIVVHVEQKSTQEKQMLPEQD